jgi:uncharacterized membrane protein YdbT with pleckstrin-like domain
MRTQTADDEQIVFEGRRHWITLCPSMLGLMIFPLLAFAAQTVHSNYVLNKVITALLFLAAAFSFFSLAMRSLDRLFTIWSITDRRLIKEWGILTRQFDEIPLNRITNISFEQSIPGRIFNYGWVGVQTAAEEGFEGFSALANPQDFIDMLNESRKSIEQGGRDMRKCPHCAELVKNEANVCRYCGRNLPKNR